MFSYISNGVVEPYLDFKVDNFFAQRRDFHTFFLSHMHEGTHLLAYISQDHLKGLTRRNDYGYFAPDEGWSWGYIYTSHKSKALLLLRFPHLKPFVKSLELQKWYTIKGR